MPRAYLLANADYFDTGAFSKSRVQIVSENIMPKMTV